MDIFNDTPKLTEDDIHRVVSGVLQSEIDISLKEAAAPEYDFPRPDNMTPEDYQDNQVAQRVEVILNPFLERAEDIWPDCQIVRVFRARDKTFCLWVSRGYMKAFESVVLLALERVVEIENLSSYQNRVSLEELEEDFCIQRQAGGHAYVNNGMFCEYDLPGSAEVKRSTVCAFLRTDSSQKIFMLGTTHRHNLQGHFVYFQKPNQHDDRKILAKILLHAQNSNPFIEAFLAELDVDNAQVSNTNWDYDEIHEGNVWDLLMEEVLFPLDGGKIVFRGQVEYLGRDRMIRDPDTRLPIDGSNLFFCRPLDCDSLSPQTSSGTGVFMSRKGASNNYQHILTGMNLFSMSRNKKVWSISQHITFPLNYFREKLGDHTLSLYRCYWSIQPMMQQAFMEDQDQFESYVLAQDQAQGYQRVHGDVPGRGNGGQQYAGYVSSFLTPIGQFVNVVGRAGGWIYNLWNNGN